MITYYGCDCDECVWMEEDHADHMAADADYLYGLWVREQELRVQDKEI